MATAPTTAYVAPVDAPAPAARAAPVPSAAATARLARRLRRDPFEGRRWTALSLGVDLLAVAAAVLTGLALVGAGDAGAPLLLVFGAGTIARLAQRGMHGARPARMHLLDTTRETVSATLLATVLALALTATLHAGDEAASALLAAGALGAVSVTAGRWVLQLARRHARITGASGKPALIVGAGAIGTLLERRLLEHPELGLVPLGFVDADPAPQDLAEGTRGPVLGGPDELAEIAQRTGAEHVIVAFSSAPDATVLPLLRRCQELGLEVSLVPRLFETINERQWTEHVGGLPLVGLRQTDPRSWAFALKHAAGRTIAGLAIVALAPVLLALCVAVRTSSPGPVLFRQPRVGRDGRAFEILKFRSMRVPPAHPADELLRRRLTAAGHAPGGVEGDDRRTHVGTLMRRSSLDELPQLLNVVLGHMSLVGPRPERPEFVELFATDVRRYGDRHRVKSGMTGWAQVHGLRGQTSLAERVEWDNWYIQNWSLWLDVKILLMTPLALLRAPAE